MSNPYQSPATVQPAKQKRSTTATLGIASLFLALYSVWIMGKDIGTTQPDNPGSLPFLLGQLTVTFLFFIAGVVLLCLSYRTPRSQA